MEYLERTGVGTPATSLADRSSRPHRCPTRTPAEVEAQVLRLRHRHRRGPAFLVRQLYLVLLPAA